MKPNRIATLLACGLLAAMLTGCTKEQAEPNRGTSRLQVVGTELEQTPDQLAAQGPKQSRATEIGGKFTFQNGDALSLFMRGATYASVDNRKVAYSKPGTAAGTWAIDGKPILLNDQTAIVSLVYPYAAGVAYDNIPFITGVYATVRDLLWKQQDVYAAVSQAQVTQMKHALTRVKLVIKRDDPNDTTKPDRFTGTGAVTLVSLSNGSAAGAGTSAAIFSAGKLDLSFAAPASPVSGVTAGAVMDKASFTLSTTGHTTDFLTVPIAALKQDLVTLNITVDGMPLKTSLPFASPAVTKWEAGTCYTYTITVKSKGIEITSSVVDNWSAGTSAGGDVEKPLPPVADHTLHPANCYIGSPGVDILFDASKKPRTLGGDLTQTTTCTNIVATDVPSADQKPASVEVCWQTAANHGKIDSRDLTQPNTYTAADMIIQAVKYDAATGICTVKPHATGAGNAVLIAKDASDAVIWNWHIWVTEGEVTATDDPGNDVNGTGKRFMDRNLGALAASAVKPSNGEDYKYYGNLYQWGRKEPFTGQGAFTTANISTPIYDKNATLIVSPTETSTPTASKIGGYTYGSAAASTMLACIQTPTTYFRNGSLYVVENSPNTWTDKTTGEKSIYDPCPYGYRIPAKGTWANADFAISVWWPAGGYRSNGGAQGLNGAILKEVSTGYIWSSSTPSGLAYGVYSIAYSSTVFYSDQSGARSMSFSVRCIEE